MTSKTTTSSTPTTHPLWDLPEVAGVRHRVLETGRLRMHVAEAGPEDGEPVLLLHGWPRHWGQWHAVIPGLADSFHVIAPDLRGSGWTDAPPTGYATDDLVDDVLWLLDALGLESVMLVGHDVGARVGFRLDVREPGRVRRIVALGAAHPFWTARSAGLASAWRAWWTPLVETTGVGRHVMRRRAHVRFLLRLGRADRRAMSRREAERCAAIACSPARALASERLFHAFAYHEIPATVRGRNRSDHLPAPTLMLNGDHDLHVAPPRPGTRDHQADDLTVDIIPGARHRLPEQVPDLVVQRVRDFFARP